MNSGYQLGFRGNETWRVSARFAWIREATSQNFDRCLFKCLFNILGKEKSLLFNYKHFFFLTGFQSEIDCHYNSIPVSSVCEGRWQETLRPATHILWNYQFPVNKSFPWAGEREDDIVVWGVCWPILNANRQCGALLLLPGPSGIPSPWAGADGAH